MNKINYYDQETQNLEKLYSTTAFRSNKLLKWLQHSNLRWNELATSLKRTDSQLELVFHTHANYTASQTLIFNKLLLLLRENKAYVIIPISFLNILHSFSIMITLKSFFDRNMLIVSTFKMLISVSWKNCNKGLIFMFKQSWNIYLVF